MKESGSFLFVQGWFPKRGDDRFDALEMLHHDQMIGNDVPGEFFDRRDEMKDGEAIEYAARKELGVCRHGARATAPIEAR